MRRTATIFVLGSLLACAPEPAPERRPSILLITLDTTRADHLGFGGYDRPTSPNLDALAGESEVYSRAISTSSWTLPAHASLFTGKFTTSHGAHYDPEGPLRLTSAIEGPESWDLYRARGLGREERTLAGLLRNAGYRTGAVVAGPWLERIFGLDRGFDSYDDNQIDQLNGRRAEQVSTAALRWLEGNRKEEFFLFLNYFDPHGPYSPPPEFAAQLPPRGASRRDQQSARYDAEILYMDHQIGRLLARMREWGIYDRTWIFVTADHGELLGEHGRVGHGESLYQEEIHIPLLIKYPIAEEQVGRTDIRVQLTDILPLICRRLGIATPDGIQGGVPPNVGHPIVAETYPLPTFGTDGEWRALLDDDLKLLWNSEERHQLFDLSADPGEQVNLLMRHPEQALGMIDRLDAYLGSLPPPGPAPDAREIDPQTRKALESLGYVN